MKLRGRSVNKPKTFFMNTNPHKAQLTYMKQISSECYNFFSILQRFNITQIHVSSSLKHFKNRVKKKFNLKDYTNKQKPCIFFGMYNKNDRDIIRNHRAISFLMPGGTDFPNFQIFRNSKDITFIAISRNIQERFKAVNQRCILIDLNLKKIKTELTQTNNINKIPKESNKTAQETARKKKEVEITTEEKELTTKDINFKKIKTELTQTNNINKIPKESNKTAQETARKKKEVEITTEEKELTTKDIKELINKDINSFEQLNFDSFIF